MNQVYSKRLYSVSAWGKLHAVPARLLIAGGHVLLFSIAVFLGVVWIPYEGNVLLVLQLILFAVAGIIAIVYPKNKGLKGLAGWAGRKKGEGGLLMCGFLLLLLTGPALREDKLDFRLAPVYATTTMHRVPAKKAQTKIGGFLQRLKHHFIETSIVLKILLALLVVVTASAIIVGIAVLTCSLACNGYEVIAALFGIGSFGFLIVGIGVALVRIFETKGGELKRKERRLERQRLRLQHNKGG